MLWLLYPVRVLLVAAELVLVGGNVAAEGEGLVRLVLIAALLVLNCGDPVEAPHVLTAALVRVFLPVIVSLQTPNAFCLLVLIILVVLFIMICDPAIVQQERGLGRLILVGS